MWLIGLKQNILWIVTSLFATEALSAHEHIWYKQAWYLYEDMEAMYRGILLEIILMDSNYYPDVTPLQISVSALVINKTAYWYEKNF